ncbi:hypothetical protein DL764_005513 [Monosporascus ibericus]|uniref:BRCT domain-containing protein n=1 Tax=Monosporascus ibericus TaxID=155417 RepID=A0A4Q4T8V7_9PEZI|nr:hypothetical protein DL764_005513 [Monosporascus ibericus]
MSPPSNPFLPTKAAEPMYGQSFDPWNTSSTGHQRAENRLAASTGWRDSRNTKLLSQFQGGAGGGRRVSDKVGAGSKDWVPKAKALISPEMRARARNSVADMLAKPGIMKRTTASLASTGSEAPSKNARGGSLTTEEELAAQRRAEDEQREAEKGRPKQIFDGVVVYVNGSTHPLVSDHKLKQLLAEHGGRLSTHLGRRQVTHVILGRPTGRGDGAGGGLASGKLQREIQKVGGCGVKFVDVEWVLESIRAGKRLVEAKFSNLKIASRGQPSVYGMYTKPAHTGSSGSEPPPSGQA